MKITFIALAVIVAFITACGVDPHRTAIADQEMRCINCGGDGDPIGYGQAYTSTYVQTTYGVNVNQADVRCSHSFGGEVSCTFSFMFGGGQSITVGCDFIPIGWDSNGDPSDYAVRCVETPR